MRGLLCERRDYLPEHGLMRVQAVFRFFEAHVHVEVVHHGVRDFFAAVSREAVADLAMCRGELQEFVVDLERQEVRLLRGLFAFLTHGNPHVAIEDVGILDGVLRVVEHAVLAAALVHERLGFFHHLGGLFKTLGAGEREVHAHLRGEGEEGVGDVVAVTDKGDRLGLVAVLETAEVFANHLSEGDSLARVIVVGQGVHDRDRTVFGELFHQVLLEAADHDGVHPAAEAAGHILDAFALAETNGIGGEEYGVATELVHAHLEGGDGSQRRFFEEHADVLAVQTVRHLASVDLFLEARGNLDGFQDFFFAPVHEAEEMFVAIDHLQSFGQALKNKKSKKRSFYTPSLTGNHNRMLTDISEVSFCDGHDGGASYACESQSSCAFFSFRKACCFSVKG